MNIMNQAAWDECNFVGSFSNITNPGFHKLLMKIRCSGVVLQGCHLCILLFRVPVIDLVWYLHQVVLQPLFHFTQTRRRRNTAVLQAGIHLKNVESLEIQNEEVRSSAISAHGRLRSAWALQQAENRRVGVEHGSRALVATGINKCHECCTRC